jgi:23S rRNA pseudouridine2605 synthase
MNNKTNPPKSENLTTAPKQDKQRIAKLIARAGLCSRRDAERWIIDGRVKVNGQIISSPALDVSPKDKILVDNELVKITEPTKLWIYHKPAGLVTSHSDPEGRETVFEHIDKSIGRVISVGRLDLTSEGLLLLTNDGELARKLELPATGLARVYRARAFGKITQEELDGLKKGIEVDGVKYGKIDALLEFDESKNIWIRVILHEGKNREIRKVLGALGLKVNRLIRLSYGPYNLGDLPRGELKEVSPKEVELMLSGKAQKIFVEKAIAPKPAKTAKPKKKKEYEPPKDIEDQIVQDNPWDFRPQRK